MDESDRQEIEKTLGKIISYQKNLGPHPRRKLIDSIEDNEIRVFFQLKYDYSIDEAVKYIEQSTKKYQDYQISVYIQKAMGLMQNKPKKDIPLPSSLPGIIAVFELLEDTNILFLLIFRVKNEIVFQFLVKEITKRRDLNFDEFHGIRQYHPERFQKIRKHRRLNLFHQHCIEFQKEQNSVIICGFSVNQPRNDALLFNKIAFFPILPSGFVLAQIERILESEEFRIGDIDYRLLTLFILFSNDRRKLREIRTFAKNHIIRRIAVMRLQELN